MAESESERLWKEIEKKERERRERMPTEADALRALLGDVK